MALPKLLCMHTGAVVMALLCIELLGCVGIIYKIAYTEIDWQAYMEEVEGFLNGELNYMNLKGSTGPLVYPAGFVYVFSLFYYVTNKGKDIETAQYIFAGVYLLVLGTVLLIYRRSKHVPVYVWVLLCLSKRIHSIFVLRMFNDCIAVLLGYLAVLLFCNNKWKWGCVFYSGAVSIKMNMLLYSPGLLLLLLLSQGYAHTLVCLSICAGIQLLLGAPFLCTYPLAYLLRSFDLGRVFMYEWTVNFKFIDEDTFTSKYLSIALLFATVSVWVMFGVKVMGHCSRAMREDTSRRKALRILGEQSLVGIGRLFDGLNPAFVTYVLFAFNFIGVCFARTLHYQFYSWYFHTVPLLLWNTHLPTLLRLCVCVCLEYAFNVYPATSTSSLVLQAAHLTLLGGLFLGDVPPLLAKHVQKRTNTHTHTHTHIPSKHDTKQD